uniref:Uncharacterized protein n=1 Tax=Ciona savignyi TaxID=51511 RepID=H2YYI4_CIOSA
NNDVDVLKSFSVNTYTDWLNPAVQKSLPLAQCMVKNVAEEQTPQDMACHGTTIHRTHATQL